MENKDKILISAYLDNDLNEEEENYVKNLLENNTEASAYFNILKETDIEVKNYYENSLKSDAAKSSFKKLDKLNLFSIPRFKVLQEYFLSRIFLSNLATASVAAFSIFIIFDVNTSLESDNTYSDPFAEFNSSSIKEFEVIKTRGVEDDNLFKKGLTKALKQMLEEKILNSKIKYGSENFFISLDEQIHSDIETNTLCFQGQIYSTLNMKFIYCSSDEENSLLIID